MTAGDFAQFLSGILVEALVPYTHGLELFGSHNHLVEFLKLIATLIQNTKQPHSIARHLLNRIAKQVEAL